MHFILISSSLWLDVFPWAKVPPGPVTSWNEGFWREGAGLSGHHSVLTATKPLLFSQQMLVEHLTRARHCAKCWYLLSQIICPYLLQELKSAWEELETFMFPDHVPSVRTPPVYME